MTQPLPELSALMSAVREEWQQSFIHFIETGEADTGFLEYMDSDPRCQEAVERAFEIKTAGLEALAEALAEPEDAVDSRARIEKDVAVFQQMADRAMSAAGPEREQLRLSLRQRVQPEGLASLAELIRRG